MREHKLEWTRPYSSKLFEGANVHRGAVIARSHPTIKFICWIRRLILIDGAWTVIEGADKWIRECSSTTFHEPQQPSVVDLAPICIFIKPFQDLGSQSPIIKKWVWAKAKAGFVSQQLVSGENQSKRVLVTQAMKRHRLRERSGCAFCNSAGALVTCVVVAGEEISRGTSRQCNPGFTAGRGYNPAGGAPGGG
ncbi:hypothetical protein F511_20393 [Dorcoceras hygrometricum]|uniref:Uncharacterized protein n=1 Tax=Dorcoceras hygrometricum TaxID=472368 RepID=A0A2Z7AUV5_9LAMI|nr:hypothetical protein F511_20393 [Dorcoceras hygrometricum]